jgi:hypothetical protein
MRAKEKFDERIEWAEANKLKIVQFTWTIQLFEARRKGIQYGALVGSILSIKRCCSIKRG